MKPIERSQKPNWRRSRYSKLEQFEQQNVILNNSRRKYDINVNQ